MLAKGYCSKKSEDRYQRMDKIKAEINTVSQRVRMNLTKVVIR